VRVDIGTKQPLIVIEPLEEPQPEYDAPEQQPVESPDREEVPA